ncbi:MAG: hypothetical protein WAU42_14720 [Solirubrobacteraceae bacterium]
MAARSHGEIMLVSGERLIVKNVGDLQAAVNDQRKTWIVVTTTAGESITMRASAIIGFPADQQPPTRRARNTKRPAKTAPHSTAAASAPSDIQP